MQNVLRKVGFSSANWKSLGRQLQRSLEDDIDLGAIEANNRKVEECLVNVIEIYQRDGNNPSWKTLVKAVSMCDGGGKNVARKILKEAGLGTCVYIAFWAFETLLIRCI